MKKHSNTIMVLGYALAVIYAMASYSCFRLLPQTAYPRELIILSVLYLVLVASSYALAQGRSQGREWIIIINVILCFFAMVSPVINPLIIPANIMIMVLLSLPTIKKQLHGGPVVGRKSILVIDDDQGFLKLIYANLISNGYQVATAATGEEGLKLATKVKPDMIILDVILPGIKGREVCLRLKEDAATRNVPVMFLTAKDSPDDIQAEMAVGAVTHLTKPVDTKRLLQEIQKILS